MVPAGNNIGDNAGPRYRATGRKADGSSAFTRVMDVGEDLNDCIGRNNAGKPVRHRPAVADDRLAHGFIGVTSAGIAQECATDVALRMVFVLFRIWPLSSIERRVIGGDLGRYPREGGMRVSHRCGPSRACDPNARLQYGSFPNLRLRVML